MNAALVCLAYALTLGRLALAGAFAACTWAAVQAAGGSVAPRGWLVALLCLAVSAELTDLLDGIAARRGKTAGRLGGLLDPMCDSLSRLTMYFAAALAGWVALAVPLVMAGRDVIVAYLRTVRALAGQTTAARISGKLKAIVQGAGLIAAISLAFAGGAGWAARGKAIVAVCVIAVTAWSLIDYIRGGWGAVGTLYRRDKAEWNRPTGIEAHGRPRR